MPQYEKAPILRQATSVYCSNPRYGHFLGFVQLHHSLVPVQEAFPEHTIELVKGASEVEVLVR